jgi:hypothetical protein
VAFTKRQRNELFEVLKDDDDPAAYELRVDSLTAYPVDVDRLTLVHMPSDSLFEIGQTEGPDGNITYLVKTFAPDGLTVRTHESGWDEVLAEAVEWALEVKYESDMPDLWEELKRAPEILAAAQQGEIGNTSFTPDEQAEISHRLDEIKQLVRDRFELTDDQLAVIDQRLDDADEASKHSDRKTWLYTFYGAVMSTFMTDEIPPHVIQTIVTTVLHGIGHLFGIGGPPPVIGL